ncbi:RND transporter, partial [bacterium]
MVTKIFSHLFTVLQHGTRRHLTWLFRLTTTRPVLVLVLALLLLLPASLSLLSLRFETDIFRLFPREKGHLRLFLDSLSWTGDAKQAYFLLEGKPEILTGEAEAFAARLTAARIDGKPAFSKITYRVYD